MFGGAEQEQNYPLRFKTGKYSLEATGQVGHKGMALLIFSLELRINISRLLILAHRVMNINAFIPTFNPDFIEHLKLY